MPALSTAQFTSARARFNESVVAFLSWWGGELLTCIPVGWRGAFAIDTRSRVLRLRNDRIELLGIQRHQLGKPTRDFVLAAGDAPQVLRRLQHSQRALGQIVPAYVRVSLSSCLVRNVVVPAAALRRLDDVVALDLERTTPFKPSRSP